MAKIIRSLRLTDSTGGLFNYSLVAMVPSGMLSICSAIISRPSWEPILKYLLLIGIILGFVAAALMAYFEAGSVVSSTVVATIRVVPTESRAGLDGGKMDPKENVSKLDLKAVYDKVDNRFKRNQKEIQSGNSKSGSSLVTSTNTYTNGKQSGSSQQQPDSTNSASNNGAVRNRKKKHSTDTNVNSNKMSDKTNTQPKASLSLLDISKGLEDTSCSSNNNNVNSSISKKEKDKENTPGTVGGKKKKNGGNSSSQQSQSQLKKKSTQSTDNFSLSNLNKSSKTEEETSSTTTESSNPDDISISLPTLGLEKERKLSEKSAGSGKDNSTNSNSGGGSKRRKDKSSVSASVSKESSPVIKETGLPVGMSPVESYNDETKKKTAAKKKDTSFTNNTGRGSISPKPDMTLWDSPRQSNGDDFTELAAATEAFVMQRPQGKRSESSDCVGMPMAMGGNLRNVNSPNGHNVSSMQFMNSNLPMSHPMQMGSRGRVRGIGVIGQPRISQQNTMIPPPQIHHANNYGPVSGTTLSNGIHRVPPAMTTMSNSMHMTTGRQHTPPAVNPNGIPVSAAKWHGGDILPDNGCDIWKRMLVDNSYTSQYRPYGEQPRPMSEMSYPTTSISASDNSPFSNVGFTAPNSFNPPVSAIGHGSHNYSARVSGSGANDNGTTPVAGLRNDAGSVSPESNDSSYTAYNGELTSEVINNLWQLNSTFDTLKNPRHGNFSAPNNQGPVDLQLQSHQHPQTQPPAQNKGIEQNYLQRMRSDPTPRQRTCSSSNLYTPPLAPYYAGMEGSGFPMVSQLLNNLNRGRNNSLDASKLDSSLPWTNAGNVPAANSTSVPLTTSPNVSVADTNVFSEWGGRSSVNATTSVSSELSRDRDADIWDSVSSVGGTTTSNASKWSTTYGTSPLQNNFTDSIAVGSSRSHLTPRTSLVSSGSAFQETGFRKRVEMAQSQREVEAGLGFNPFTSDIWNQSETSTWGGNYRYSSNE